MKTRPAHDVLWRCWSPALLLWVALAASAGGQDRFAGLDAYIGEVLEKWQVPGLAIAVVKDGQVVLARGFTVNGACRTR